MPPQFVRVGEGPVVSCVVVGTDLWVGCQNSLHRVDTTHKTTHVSVCVCEHVCVYGVCMCVCVCVCVRVCVCVCV